MDDSSNTNSMHEEEVSTSRSYRLDISRGIYPLAVLGYLILGLVWGLWHPGWVIFFVAWLAEGIMTYVKTGKLKISVYGIAAIIFVIVIVFFREWRYTWLVFVAAWVIDEMIVPSRRDKKKKSKHKEGND